MKNSVILDFIGIGAAKAGTTWISDCLAEHPRVCFSRPKELNFFCQKTFLPESVSNSDRGLSWFKSRFNNWQDGQLRGEFSPSYLIDPTSPRTIHQHRSDIKLIVCLRNPVDSLYSLYYQFRKHHIITDSFESFIGLNTAAVESGFYFKHIERYLNYFPLGNFHFIFFDDLTTKPLDVLRDLFKFLNIDDLFVPSTAFLKVNPRKEPRFLLPIKIINSVKNVLNQNSNLKKVKYKLSALGFEFLANKALEFNLRQPEAKTLASPTRESLLALYFDDIVKLQQITGRNLGDWCKLQ